MKNNMRYLMLLLLVGLSVAACEKETGQPVATPADTPVQQGSVAGKVVTAQNAPVQGAKITIEHTVWHASYLFAASGADGAYRVDLPADPAGSWTAKAQLTKTAYGNTYKFDLDPDKTDAFNRGSGATRNFVWRLSGKRPGTGSSYGAHVDLYQFGTDADMTRIKLVFTPYPGEATLVDGTQATSFERTVEDVAGTFMVKDIPIGKYTVKAVYPGKQLLLNNRHEEDNNEPTKTVVFGKWGYLGETEYNIEFFVTEQ